MLNYLTGMQEASQETDCRGKINQTSFQKINCKGKGKGEALIKINEICEINQLQCIDLG